MGKITDIDLKNSAGKEWLVTNGLGGYASSSIINLNTRKYHGLLIASFDPADDRRLILSKLDEEFLVEGIRYPIHCNMYRDCVDPLGFIFQTSFSLDPFPKFTYKIGDIEASKTVFMPHGANAVVIKYSIDNGGSPGLLKANFLLSSRNLHWIVKDPVWDFKSKRLGEGLVFRATHENAPYICIGSTDGNLVVPKFKDQWLRNLYYKVEDERGFESLEDLFMGATLMADTKNGKKEFYVICSSSLSEESAIEVFEEISKDPKACENRERERLDRLKRRFYHLNKARLPSDRGSLDSLISNSDSFIVKRDGLKGIMAGYPWFTIWGRDSLISLPGLCLVTKRFDVAENILLDLIKRSRGGLIPNNYISGRPDYNSLDTPLWFFWAVGKYLEYTKNYNFVQEKLWSGMRDILSAYIKGTDYGIKVDNDGLVASSSKMPLAWMDAVVDGIAVTPRTGKAVEVQALWYNSLRIAIDLCKEFNEDYSAYESQAFMAKENFPRVFWNDGEGCLYDSVYGKHKDGSIRPNQILAVSMPFSMLGKDKERGIVKIVKDNLVTPYGLRTLARDEEGYVGVYKGNFSERDKAYHQGTVWPWLLGPFITAYVRVNGNSRSSKKDCFEFLKPLLKEHLNDAGMGSISEVFDGDPPHNPGGCISQAWSVAEILRTLFEDILV
ncbi:MAG: glycogen debranching enzyme N-terminal domain-containing protein [Candidatus Altiarchaeota archaeon]|nr:glycogen debranching enzyme N-terminal domain-containing protein [Candidatus Altiarchaeota archaeon]